MFSPRIAPGIGVAMARVGARFYFFSILVVGSTIYLPHPVSPGPVGLAILAFISVSMIFLLHFFPWDRYQPRLFTFSYTLSSAMLMATLVYFTGGLRSSYDLLFFLIILFSFFYNLVEMLLITTVVTLFYLLPHIYGKPQPYQYAATTVTVMFFYLGTYMLYGVSRFMLKKNIVLEELNKELLDLHLFTAGILSDIEDESIIDSLSESLKDHLPSTYAVMLLLDDTLNLTVRIACPVRTLTWEPSIGTVYPPDTLVQVRDVLNTRQPKLYRIELDLLNEDFKRILTKETRSVLVVPIRITAENVGVLIFGEERRWERTSITNEKIQVAVALSRQVAVSLKMRSCYDRLNKARHELEISQDKIIKAERLATLGEVTKAVEHEINNPLNVIVNWAEIYREDESIDPEVRKKFQIVFDMAMRITGVIRKLSDLKDAKSVEFIKGQKMTSID